MNQNTSDLVNDAIYIYLDRHSKIDLKNDYPEIKNIIERSNKFMNASINHEFHERENFMSTNKLKGITFFDYVDKQLGEIYLRNKETFTEKQLIHQMKEYVKAQKFRVKDYNEKFEEIDYKEKYEQRLNDPLEYAKAKLDQISSIEELQERGS